MANRTLSNPYPIRTSFPNSRGLGNTPVGSSASADRSNESVKKVATAEVESKTEGSKDARWASRTRLTKKVLLKAAKGRKGLSISEDMTKAEMADQFALWDQTEEGLAYWAKRKQGE